MKGWSRRGILGAALALIAGAPFGLRGCSAGDPRLALNAALSDWFQGDAAAAVGKRVLALGEGWNAEAALREPVVARLSGAEAAADARRELTDAIRDDFGAGRMVAVEGWLLAETEARLYALAALRGAAGG